MRGGVMFSAAAACGNCRFWSMAQDDAADTLASNASAPTLPRDRTEDRIIEVIIDVLIDVLIEVIIALLSPSSSLLLRRVPWWRDSSVIAIASPALCHNRGARGRRRAAGRSEPARERLRLEGVDQQRAEPPAHQDRARGAGEPAGGRVAAGRRPIQQPA